MSDTDALPAPLLAVWIVCGVAALVAWVLSCYLIALHWKYFSQPAHQRYIVRIVMLVPLYTLYSFLSLLFFEYQVYLAILRDAYEAFVLYQFFRLCINYCGGREQLGKKLASVPESMKCPMPLCCVKADLSGRFIRRNAQGILQYVIVRPITSLVAIGCEFFGVYDDGDWSSVPYLVVQVVNNVSFTVSLYCLFAFYKAIAREIRPYKPLLKFLTIKSAVFISFWQGILLSVMVSLGWIPPLWRMSAAEASVFINNALLCVELLLIAVLHIWAYPIDLYKITAMSQVPLVHRVHQGGVLQSVRHTLSQKDTIRDAVRTFVPLGLQHGDSEWSGELSVDSISLDLEHSQLDLALEDNLAVNSTAKR